MVHKVSANKNEASSFQAELLDLANRIRQNKSTCDMYKLQDLLDTNLQQKKSNFTSNRSVVMKALESVKYLIPSKILQNQFDKAIELDDQEFCVTLINSVQMLDEHQALKCIKYFLRDLTVDDIEKNENENEDFTKRSKIIEKLNLIFQKKYDYHLFSTELRSLSSNEFIICLHYFQEFLKKSMQERGEEKDATTSSTESATKIPTPTSKTTTTTLQQQPNILQIIELFSSFVDVHFTHITLSSRAQEIVADVLQLIESQLDSFRDLMSIESLISEIKQNEWFNESKQSTHTKNGIGHYYIEVLKLK